MIKKILLGIVLVLLLIPLYAFKIEPNLAVVHRIRLGDKSKPEALNVLQLSEAVFMNSSCDKIKSKKRNK